MNINFPERLMSFFGHKVVFYLKLFAVLKDIIQHEKLAFPRRQDNQASRTLPPSCLFLCSFCFLFEVVHLCNLFIIQIRCRDPWIVFAEKGCHTKSCEKEMED